MHDSAMSAQAVAMTTPDTQTNTSLNDSPESHSSLYLGESPGTHTESDHTDSGELAPLTHHSRHPQQQQQQQQHQDVLQRLKEQVASVMQSHLGKESEDLDSSDLRTSVSAQSPAMAAPPLSSHHPRLSPQSLLAASIRFGSPSMLGMAAMAGARFGFGDVPGSVISGLNRPSSPKSPSQQRSSHGHTDEDEEDEEVEGDLDDESPREGSASLSPRPATNGSQTPWNYEEQFKQLYEIDDSPKRREFLDDIFRFMHNRGTPINRLPIMAKQVLDLFELFNLVVARGGLVEVINKKLWQEIIKGLKLPSSITSAAFTLRTQYMKYLYPYECHTKNLSNPSELQSAIDGNRREGRRTSYNSQSYAELMQRSPLMSGSLHPSQYGGLPNGLTTNPHHHSIVSPMSLAGSRPPSMVPSSTALGHPIPPSSPFFHGLNAPLLPSPNDTLLTLWNLYNKRGVALSPPLPKSETPSAAPQNEALNLGVRKHMARQEQLAEMGRERKRAAEIERAECDELERGVKLAVARAESRDRLGGAATPPPALKKVKHNDNNNSSSRPTPVNNTKLSISSGDNSMVVSMELNGVTYQGVLFAQTEMA